MSSSLIQTANQSQQTVAVNSIIDLGLVQRRFGNNIRMSGDAFELTGAGYYVVSASITATPTAVGNVTVEMYVNGVPYQGALGTGSVSVVGNSTNISVITTVRKGCCDVEASNITFVLTEGAGVIDNISVRVEKA